MTTKTKKTAKKLAPKKKTTTALAPGKVLVLRTCAADMSAHGGFIWPKSGPISAPDWKPTKECGAGLHGLLWGEGNGDVLSWAVDAAWLVVEVEKDKIIDLDGKVKFPSCVVVHCGNQKSATEYLAAHGAEGRAITGGTATAGDRGTATAGDGGTATAGYRGTATAGPRGTATAGDGGTATAGEGGTATAGEGGTATAGDRGTATAGDGGTATAGDGGSLLLKWWDGSTGRYRACLGEVGIDGIKANVKYRVESGKLVEVKP